MSYQFMDNDVINVWAELCLTAAVCDVASRCVTYVLLTSIPLPFFHTLFAILQLIVNIGLHVSTANGRRQFHSDLIQRITHPCCKQ